MYILTNSKVNLTLSLKYGDYNRIYQVSSSSSY